MRAETNSEKGNGDRTMTREEAIQVLQDMVMRFVPTDQYGDYDDSEPYEDAVEMAIEALSAEPPYQYSKAYVEQIRGERDILQDMVDNMAKPKTEMVLCALADRACPFQGREFALCLTCPHISEEDRALVKKAVAEPKAKWIPCSERLPSESGWYLITVQGCEKVADMEWYYGEWDAWNGVSSEQQVLAWMPLPEPYKGGEEE